MKILETKYKRKSATITILILLLLLFSIFNFGMKYQDPPIEYGLAINFGDSDVGSGEPVENTKQQEQLQEEESNEEVVEEVEEEVEEAETLKEDVLTDDTVEDAPVVEKAKNSEAVKSPEKSVEKKKEPKKAKKPKAKPKPSKATSNALNALLNGNTNNGGSKGEGDDDVSGVKGNKNGDPNSNKYYGNAGSGSGGNYNLSGRNALSKPIKKPDCEEEGTVVVVVYVDNNGKVTRADPGEKGSTNTAPCLLKAAKEAALQTKWNPDSNAPKKQKGAIIYKFSLSK